MTEHADRQRQEEQPQDEEDRDHRLCHHRSGHHIPHRYQYEYNHDRPGSRPKRSNTTASSIRCSDTIKPKFSLGTTPKIPIDALVHKSKSQLHMAPESQPRLHPTGQARAATRGIRERTKPSRLNGADLYVARMGHMKVAVSSADKIRAQAYPERYDSFNKICQCDAAMLPVPSETSSTTSRSTSFSSAASASVASSATSTSSSLRRPVASLHDELRFPNGLPKAPPARTETTDFNSTNITKASESISRSHVHASRPCYRCITYMHNVGIKRVFWTNSEGQWEGGKVRDLVDILDGGGAPGPDGAEDAMGMFVTKHEVLMLRRVMGAKQTVENCSHKSKKTKRA